jgi:DNA-binding GntR family transcriptional regulator
LSLLLGVSPTPIREALARLEPEGLIEKTAHKGYAATDILSPKEFLDLYKFRLLIEPWAAEQAAKLATNCDKKLIKDEMAFAKTAIKYGKEEGVEALTRHDARFHNLISQMSRNNLISHAFERTNCHLHLFRLYVANQKNLIDPQSRPDFVQDLFETYYKSKSGKKALEEHTTIALAIVSGDSRLAQKAMKNHIESSLERFAHYQEE